MLGNLWLELLKGRGHWSSQEFHKCPDPPPPRAELQVAGGGWREQIPPTGVTQLFRPGSEATQSPAFPQWWNASPTVVFLFPRGGRAGLLNVNVPAHTWVGGLPLARPTCSCNCPLLPRCLRSHSPGCWRPHRSVVAEKRPLRVSWLCRRRSEVQASRENCSRRSPGAVGPSEP